MANLVIVESPTKAKTISRFLGKDYKIESSYGHLRDLPKSKMGIDIENDFEPHYIIPRDKKKIATALKKVAQKADKIYFATDEDREGEAISWHLLQILKVPEAKTERIVFHEITKEAILKSLKKPRKIDLNLVDAQQGRRVLDRLVGYELSPFLWRKVAKGLSAGRVQSVAVRLVVEREREIKAFQSQEYWQIQANLKTEKNKIFTAHLQKINGKPLDKFYFTSKEQIDKVIQELENADFIISNITKKQTRKNPLPPYTTSTLQQDANRRLGFSAKQTMMLAQQLYEGVKLGSQGEIGLITYMRTDSVSLSEKFLKEAEEEIKQKFGTDYHEQRIFKTKSKNAQEAHEAIRPTNASLDPEQIKKHLDSRQYKLYKLIWQRAVASQMKPALVNTISVDIAADKYTFRSTGAQIHFQGFLKIYPMQVSENTLPNLTEKEELYLEKIYGEQKFTQPPARYSEAGLVKALEQRGIGRPSTYAPTISTILARNYVTLEDKRLKPTEIGILVNDVLVEHFPEIVDYNFTAKIENELDEIAMGKLRWQKVIKEFYEPFKKNLTLKDESLNKKDLTEEKTDEKCEKCGAPMVIKMGRFGKFLACSNYPECKNTKNINVNGETEVEEKINEKCPKCGHELQYKHGRFGKFIGCSNYPECKFIKSIENKIGVKCPECGKGDIVSKKTRRGRIFYACNRYPECKFSLWSKPTGEKCPKCHSLLIFAAENTIRCSNKECNYTIKSKE